MKKVIIVFFVTAICCQVQAQEEKEKKQIYVLHHAELKKGKEKQAIERMKAHDEKYHKEGEVVGKGFVGSIINGKNAGHVYWTYGPFAFADWDTSELAKEHEADNNEIRQEFIEKHHGADYWVYNKDLSLEIEGKEYGMKRIFEFVKLHPGKNEQFGDLVKKHLKVMKENKIDNAYTFNAAFGRRDGYNVLLVFPFTNWAELDERNPEYKEQFEKIHGEGALKKAGEEWGECVESYYVEVVIYPETEE